MWYIAIVFFASGQITGPAHLEPDWFPRPMLSLGHCQRVGGDVLSFLRNSATTLNGEAYQIACIMASGPEELNEIMQQRWTFETAPVPAAPPVLDTPA